jgi:hypothetical protein
MDPKSKHSLKICQSDVQKSKRACWYLCHSLRDRLEQEDSFFSLYALTLINNRVSQKQAHFPGRAHIQAFTQDRFLPAFTNICDQK